MLISYACLLGDLGHLIDSPRYRPSPGQRNVPTSKYHVYVIREKPTHWKGALELLPVHDLILGHRVSCFLSLDITYSCFVILQTRKRKLRGVGWLHLQKQLEWKDTPGLQTPGPKFFLYDSHPPRSMVGSMRVWKVKVSHSVMTHMDYSPSGFSVHGILQARLLEWVAKPFSRASTWPRGRTHVSCTAGKFSTIWATREALTSSIFNSVGKKPNSEGDEQCRKVLRNNILLTLI